jgi:hypothetical protein
MSIPPRLTREKKTITAMVKIYCRSHHAYPEGSLCQDCCEFLLYAEKRLSYCPFAEKKPTCGQCPVHCYKEDMQEKAKEIMRFSGPRMLWRHPIMAIFHFLDGMKKVPNLQSCRKVKKNSK